MIPLNVVDKKWMGALIAVLVGALLIFLIWLLMGMAGDKAVMDHEVGVNEKVNEQVAEGKKDVREIFEDKSNSIADYVSNFLQSEIGSQAELRGANVDPSNAREKPSEKTGVGGSYELLDTEETEKYRPSRTPDTSALPTVIYPEDDGYDTSFEYKEE